MRAYKLALLIFTLLSFGCMKDDTGIPNIIVDIRVPIHSPELVNLQAPTGFVFLNGGVAGIVVYNTGNGYVAYDRCSTVNPEERCRVELDNTGYNLVDRCSGAMFFIATGAPAKPPAKHGLKRYSAGVSNGMLHIRN